MQIELLMLSQMEISPSDLNLAVGANGRLSTNKFSIKLLFLDFFTSKSLETGLTGLDLREFVLLLLFSEGDDLLSEDRICDFCATLFLLLLLLLRLCSLFPFVGIFDFGLLALD